MLVNIEFSAAVVNSRWDFQALAGKRTALLYYIGKNQKSTGIILV